MYLKYKSLFLKKVIIKLEGTTEISLLSLRVSSVELWIWPDLASVALLLENV